MTSPFLASKDVAGCRGRSASSVRRSPSPYRAGRSVRRTLSTPSESVAPRPASERQKDARTRLRGRRPTPLATRPRHNPMKKQKCIQCVVLVCRHDLIVDGEVRQARSNLLLSERTPMTRARVPDVAHNSAEICILGRMAVSLPKAYRPKAVDKSRSVILGGS